MPVFRRLAAAACAAAAFATPAAAMAEDWWFVADDGVTIGFIDVESVTGSSASRSAFVLIASDSVDGVQFGEVELLLNCNTREWTLYSMTIRDSLGSVISSDVVNLPPEPIQDHTPAADVEAYLCQGDTAGMVDVGDPYTMAAQFIEG